MRGQFLRQLIDRKVAAHETAELDRLQRRWRRRARRWGFSTPCGQCALLAREACWQARNLLLGWPNSEEGLSAALNEFSRQRP